MQGQLGSGSQELIDAGNTSSTPGKDTVRLAKQGRGGGKRGPSSGGKHCFCDWDVLGTSMTVRSDSDKWLDLMASSWNVG